jgi:hypothetical protein
MRQKRMKKWARRAYTKACEVLHRTGQRNSADSMRAILTDVIGPYLSARVTTTKSELRDWARINNYSGHLDSQLFGFRFEVGKIKAWWLRKLESEAWQCELAARVALGSEPQVANKAKALTGSKSLSKKEMVGIRRASAVARLIKELNALRPHMQLPEEDFPKLAKEHPAYEAFEICKKHPGASKWVKLVRERRIVNSLAYQLAAIEEGVSAAMMETAWKRHKRKLGRAH